MAKRKASKSKAETSKNDIDENNGEAVDNEEYEVEKIIHHRKFSNGTVEYLIRWKGYGPDDDTWEKESNLTSSAVLIAEYKEENKVSSDDEEEEEDKTNGKEDKSDAEAENKDNDDDDDDAPVKKKKKSSTPASKTKGKGRPAKSKGRGRPKGSVKSEGAKKKATGGKKSKKEESEDEDGEETTEEYEVEKIIDVYNGKNGKKEYLVRWKGFSSKDDTWEPEAHLTCPDLIKQFNDKLGKIKGLSEKSLRAAPAKTSRLIVQNSTPSGRHSKRFVGKRKSYAEEEV